MKEKISACIFIVLFNAVFQVAFGQQLPNPSSTTNIIISSDIGGDDPDDYQSLIHLLVNADKFSIHGLISSPPGKGRVDHIMEVLSAYEHHYNFLISHSRKFPQPDSLRQLTKQGAVDIQSDEMPGELSTGAAWIVKKALDLFPQPLYVLVWGSLTDVAQAVHNNPLIKKNLRVYSIGSWNTKQDPKARDYLFLKHKDLWWIENNTSFRGMYIGGKQDGNLSNTLFVKTYVKDFGALGKLFWEKKKDIKMGDTPSVLYFLSGDPNNPEQPSWGGSFHKTFKNRNYWTDLRDDKYREKDFDGAVTINRYRELYLNDWAKRMALLPFNGGN
jgi:hypothetical protein